MCKIFAAVALLAVAVYAQPGMPSAEDGKAELVAAGVSADAAAGIIAIVENHKSEFEAAKGDRDAMKKVYEEVKTETDAYIKIQSEADQTAYAAFVAKNTAEFEKHHHHTTAATH